MTMIFNACVKQKHPPDFGSFVNVPPEERMANYSVVSHLNELTTCAVKIPSLPGILRFVTCSSQGTVDACDSVCRSPREKVKNVIEISNSCIDQLKYLNWISFSKSASLKLDSS
ncbi:hypothetical protein AVEN_1007-1 [Araneus ventricosus]|uniref:Uncharacterized protein n=1 Tax=Araneus ventricosus TaxID=182803 RepID=A0A4Y2U111_ARAVE|nr:hypothetical protein AVEN_136008-1 [Araneus ventricosus]GBO06234.1 hypothetical protein AVEN_11227-1 [Araneus ventricosus]GBO06625.1 hypothetical protein AVEN_131799-1 [Araneus ventricosus]GBO06679.1 hypothetical protein AVEN_1007-1 [Araneus ventricosus]